MDSIEITIDTDINDMRRFALWRLFHSKLYWLYCGVVVISATVLLIAERNMLLNNEYQGVILVAVVLIGLPVSAVLGIVRHVWKRLGGLKKRIVRFEPEGIRTINDQLEALYRWQEAMIITETKRYLFATVGKRPVFVLCKYRLDQATIDNVRAFVSQKISEVKAN